MDHIVGEEKTAMAQECILDADKTLLIALKKCDCYQENNNRYFYNQKRAQVGKMHIEVARNTNPELLWL